MGWEAMFERHLLILFSLVFLGDVGVIDMWEIEVDGGHQSLHFQRHFLALGYGGGGLVFGAHKYCAFVSRRRG